MNDSISVDFDKLGLTDNENPLGVLPPFFGRSMGRAAGTFLGNWKGNLFVQSSVNYSECYQETT